MSHGEHGTLTADIHLADHHVDDPQGPPHIHHMDPPTAYHAAKFGMWLFLATELLLFGVMFAAFAVFRVKFFHEFHEASTHLNWMLGGLNTAVLLVSSYYAAIAVDHAQHGRNKKVFSSLLITIGCACGFLVIKAIEYSEKYSHGYFPGGENFHHYKTFLPLYFCMTGIHALHVVIGMGLLGWVASLARKNRFSGRYYTPVEVGALYWHLVDLIWIYLFPLLYLVG
jgi:cytochrome c oxidase subunit 3